MGAEHFVIMEGTPDIQWPTEVPRDLGNKYSMYQSSRNKVWYWNQGLLEGKVAKPLSIFMHSLGGEI